jgi:hypothetical protein
MIATYDAGHCIKNGHLSAVAIQHPCIIARAQAREDAEANGNDLHRLNKGMTMRATHGGKSNFSLTEIADCGLPLHAPL